MFIANTTPAGGRLQHDRKWIVLALRHTHFQILTITPIIHHGETVRTTQGSASIYSCFFIESGVWKELLIKGHHLLYMILIALRLAVQSCCSIITGATAAPACIALATRANCCWSYRS